MLNRFYSIVVVNKGITFDSDFQTRSAIAKFVQRIAAVHTVFRSSGVRKFDCNRIIDLFPANMMAVARHDQAGTRIAFGGAVERIGFIVVDQHKMMFRRIRPRGNVHYRRSYAYR